ncbi:hypothetical protein KoPa4_00045 [Pseudomonas phage vB_PpuM-KoPa-4]|uniref:Phage protein n=1 Tax=Pseudomonas phage vB_PpuM-KoPa-4 TaxID=3132618 RepID=A0AAX4MY71_9CAUD
MEALKVGTKLVNVDPGNTGIVRKGHEFTVVEVVPISPDDPYADDIGPFIYALSEGYQCDHSWLAAGYMEVVE